MCNETEDDQLCFADFEADAKLKKRRRFRRKAAIPVRPRIHITDPIPVVRLADEDFDGSLMRWGILPSWAKDRKAGGYALFNTRLEDVEEKRSFARSFASRRCLVLVRAYVEYQPRPGAKKSDKKERFRVSSPDGMPIALAGIWDAWTDPQTGEVVESTSIMTREAEGHLAKMRELHDRVVIALSPDEIDPWLDPHLTTKAELAPFLMSNRSLELVIERVAA